MKQKAGFHFLLWFIPCLLLVTIPLIISKATIEDSSKTVEFITPYDNNNKVAELTKQSKEEWYGSLKEMGVTSLSLTKNSLKNLENKGYISMLSFGEMNEFRGLLGEYQPKTKETTFVVIFDRALEKEILASIHTRFEEDIVGEETLFKGNKMIEIGKSINEVANLSLPFLEREYKEIVENGFMVAPVLENDWEDKENPVLTQVETWKEKGMVSKVLYVNGEVLGHPNQLSINEPFSMLGTKPIKIIKPEKDKTETFDGEDQAKFIEKRLVRSHVIPAAETKKYYDNKKINALSDRITLAVQERNIHLIYFDFPLPSKEKDEKMLTAIGKQIKEASKELQQSGFTIGTAKAFTSDEQNWMTYLRVIVFALAVLFVSYTLSLLHKKLFIFSLGGLSLLYVACAIVGKGMLYLQGIAFLVAISIPMVAIYTLMRYLEKRKEPVNVVMSLLLFILTSVCTITLGLLLPAMHSDITYVLYLNQFRGVQLVHVLPILLAALLVLTTHKASMKAVISFLKVKIAVYHIAIVAIAAFVLGVCGMFYLMRTGNGGTLLPFETLFRQTLEDTFGVRPRTKEILIGHPLLIVAIFYWNRYKIMRWLLPFGIIGQLSMINTFTHFHTPFIYSLLRSLYGVGLSVLTGLAFLLIAHFAIKISQKLWVKMKHFITSIEKEKAEE